MGDALGLGDCAVTIDTDDRRIAVTRRTKGLVFMRRWIGVGDSDNSLTPQLSAAIISENQVGEKHNCGPISVLGYKSKQRRQKSARNWEEELEFP